MGTVYARGTRLWLGFSAPVGPNGKRLRFHRASGYSVGQEPQAREELRIIEERIRAGGGPPVPVVTLAEFGRRWAAARVGRDVWTNAKLDQQALENHLYAAPLQLPQHLGGAVKFGELGLGAVRELHVRAWLEQLETKGLAGRTRSSLYSLLNRIFKRAERDELVTRNPCKLTRDELPRQVDQDPAWRAGARFTVAELEQLISDARVPLDRRVFYAIGFLGGLREGEIAALRWRSYDARLRPLGCFSVGASYTRKNKREKEPKSGRPRKVPVHPLTAKLLATWRATGWRRQHGRAPTPDDLVVPNRAGTYVTDLNVSENWHHDLELLGLRHRRFHDTKRTFVSLCRERGATPLLRWVSHGPTAREMLDVYSSPDWKALCSEVLRLKAKLRTGKVVQLSATEVTSRGGFRVPLQRKTASAQGEIRTRPRPLPAVVPRGEVSRASLKATGTEGHRSSPVRSGSTTALPYRGGMRIEG
jgi:integrase